MGSFRDREVACSASDRQGSNFESCVWRTVSSQSSHHPQEVLLAQFSLYVDKGGLKPDSFHFTDYDCSVVLTLDDRPDPRVRVVIPTSRYSDRSIFRQVVIPTGRYSDKQVVIPTGRYSDRSIFRRVVIPTGRYSDKQVAIPTGR